jgi:hypothetical protein
MIKADRKGKASRLENLRPYHRMEPMWKCNILSWLLFVLVSFSCIKAYSLLSWLKVYIPHLWWAVFLKSLGIIPFSKIFCTVLLATLTNYVSFLILHLFTCVALLCIYIIVIIVLLIYVGFQFYYICIFIWHT